MTLPRGFKAEAEREAIRPRKEMGLAPTAPLNVQELAMTLGVRVVSAEQLIDMERLHELERLQAFAFSAATFEISGRRFIVTNPLRTEGRLASDVAHELSHVLLKHDLSELRELDGVPFRSCRPDEEEQATAFGGTLMLPRPMLVAMASRGLGPEEIAERCVVTVEMARFRYNTTGVVKQVGRRRSG